MHGIFNKKSGFYKYCKLKNKMHIKTSIRFVANIIPNSL